MTDVVVTVPKHLWEDWLDEGDLPGERYFDGDEYHFYLGGPRPDIKPGERVYIVAHGKVRGYAPLVRVEDTNRGFALVRHGGAVAVTLKDASGRPEFVRGFQGWRYRWWLPEDEMPFPEFEEP